MVENTATNGQSDYVLTSAGYARAAVRTIQSTNAQVQPTWLPFVREERERIGDAGEATRRQGAGRTQTRRLEGKAAIIADPTGGAIGIMEWQAGMLKGDR